MPRRNPPAKPTGKLCEDCGKKPVQALTYREKQNKTLKVLLCLTCLRKVA